MRSHRLVAVSVLLIIGIIGGPNQCSCLARPPQDYLSIELGSSRGAQAIEWLLGRLGGPDGDATKADESVANSTSSSSAADGVSTSASSSEVSTSGQRRPTGERPSEWSAEMVAFFLRRAASIARQASLVPRNKLPPAQLDRTGVLSYRDGDFFTLEYGLRKLANLQQGQKQTDSGGCFSESDTNEYLQLINRAFGSVANFATLLRSPTSAAAATPYPSLLDYLRVYGREHFADCLARVSDKFREAESHLDGEKLFWFDQLVAATKRTFRRPQNERLASMARELDFDRSQLNINRLAELVRPQLASGSQKAPLSSGGAAAADGEVVTQFLSVVCHNLRGTNLNAVFTVYNLGRVFLPKEAEQLELEMPDSFMKLNEYQRLCNQFRGASTRRSVSINLKENEEKGLFRRLFGFERVAKPVSRKSP